MTSFSPKWIILPSSLSLKSTITTIDLNQLLKINDLEFGNYHLESKCIQKYNIIDNKWTNWIKLNDFNIDTTISLALNQSKLYVCTNQKLITINTKQNTDKIYDYYTHNPATIIINNKLHLIAGFDNKHSILNEQQSQFEVQHIFEFNALYFHRLLYLKSKNILLCMGGRVASGNTIVGTIDAIYSLDITSNKWSKLKQKLPIANCLFGCISTRNEEYIILFGGNTKGIYIHSKIYILNTKTMKCRESAICCPKKGIFQAINMNSKERDELLCFGYIKQLWNTKEFNNLINIPFYLMNIIRQYIAIEMVHLISTHKHWKMNVDEIITTPFIMID